MVKSWVWQYAEKKNNKAYCNICNDEENNELSCVGGSTGAISNHLEKIHGLHPQFKKKKLSHDRDVNEENMDNSEDRPEENLLVSNSSTLTSSGTLCSSSSSQNEAFLISNRKRHRRPTNNGNRNEHLCNAERSEIIDRNLTKMIAMTQLPLSFVSSSGFIKFMSVIEPNYKICKEKTLKKRLSNLYAEVKNKIREELRILPTVACTSDCWTSLAQDSYLTMTVHFINDEWKPKSYTLTTQLMIERHTAANLSDTMRKIFTKWEISEKVIAVVTDNAANVVNAVRDMEEIQEQDGLTCAAHTLQLVVNEVLAYQEIQQICQKAGKLVGHFRHSNTATTALQSKQAQLNIKSLKLIQSVKTRWNSTFEMLERLIANRLPISNVLVDRNITTSTMARKLEITEEEWAQIEELVSLLKPLQMATTVFCSENNSPASIVRPLIWKIIRHHMQPIPGESNLATTFKTFVSTELQKRFKLIEWEIFSNVSARLTASFLDPRSKKLEDESIETRQMVQEHVRYLLNTESISATAEESTVEEDTIKAAYTTALDFLFYQPVDCPNDAESQLQAYLMEPQLRFDLDYLEWWKARADRFPTLAILARKYLCIPATSASAERTFSTAGNIVTPKRNCLAPENVNMLVFLYQNKSVYMQE